mmetsp:Transcript_10192/g.25201  ORF Transcript_10192/g.25201 Transcript_10192/m.25201 type:complete len:226 (+) Transcript_10192:441-1118(+)
MSFLLLSLRIEHSERAPADCDWANESWASSKPIKCGIAPTSATRCLLPSLSTHKDHRAPAAWAAAAWFSLCRTLTRTSSAPDVAIVSLELRLAARLQMQAAAADCMKGTSGDGLTSMSIREGRPPACTTSSLLLSVSEHMLHSAAAAFAFSVGSGDVSIIIRPSTTPAGGTPRYAVARSSSSSSSSSSYSSSSSPSFPPGPCWRPAALGAWFEVLRRSDSVGGVS